MHPIFSVSVEEISALTDIQARELVARLCKAELARYRESESSVSWGGDQRAKDGGVDVRIDANPTTFQADFVPRAATAFQVKAEKLGPARIAEEMAPGSVLRPIFSDLASGAYVIVSTRDNLSDSSLISRKRAMKNVLDGHSAQAVHVDFFDARRVADWVEQHPSISTWVKYVTGKPISGWQPLRGWAYREADDDSPYLLDDDVKVFRPHAQSGVTAIEAIDEIRGRLASGRSTRLVGLSGVGKTRLAQALFDSRIVTKHPTVPASQVVYTDLADSPSPTPAALFEALLVSGGHTIVVVDNCGAELHQRLNDLTHRSLGRISLLTIEYDVREDVAESTVCFRLDGSSDDLVKRLLRRRYTSLANLEIDRIADFSAGNSRVAFALADTCEKGGELARLEDSELFRRLFIQKNSESDELLRCAQIASLTYSVDVENIAVSSELAILASLADVSSLAFSRRLAELKSRGLLQRRGRWAAVLPHAISNRLAAIAIDQYPTAAILAALVDKAPDRMRLSFSRRLGLLHESERVRSIAEAWFEKGGLLEELPTLDETHLQMFRNLAAAAPDAALNVISSHQAQISSYERAFDVAVELARSLAYEPEKFDRATALLLSFATNDKRRDGQRSARSALESLFFCHLSGTLAPPKQREKFVRRLLTSANELDQELGIGLLGASLEATHFNTIYPFEFGARRRDYGWWPRTREEIVEWYAPFVQLAVEVGVGEYSTGDGARIALGDAFRGLWSNAGVHDLLEWAATQLTAVRPWPEGWLGVKRASRWDKKGSAAQTRRLSSLAAKLAPKELADMIRAKVLTRGSFAFDADEREGEEPMVAYERARSEAARLGDLLSHQKETLRSLMPEIMAAPNDKVWSLGKGIGESGAQAIEDLLEVVEDLFDAKRHNLLFVRGMLTGWLSRDSNGANAFLDRALNHRFWAAWFPELQVQAPLDERSYQRLLRSIELGAAPVWQFSYLGFGRKTDALSVEQIFDLLRGIVGREDTTGVVIELLGMVIYGSRERDEVYRLKLAVSTMRFLPLIDLNVATSTSDNQSYHLEEVVSFVLRHAPPKKALSMLRWVLRFERSQNRRFSYRRGRLLRPFLKYLTNATLDAIFVPDKTGGYDSAIDLAANPYGERDEHPATAIPIEELLVWCGSTESRFAFAAAICSVFQTTKTADATKTHVADDARRLLSSAPNKAQVLERLLGRFWPRRGSGSLAEQLRGRIDLIDEFELGDDQELATIRETARANLHKYYLEQLRTEEARDAARDESFE
jgi:hypothetical protein